MIHRLRGLAAPHPVIGAGLDHADDDLQLALYCCYELHYRGFADVEPDLEWDPGLLALRAELERAFLAGLIDQIGPIDGLVNPVQEIRRLATRSNGPSLSTFMATRGTIEHFREFCIHRSAYQLKEADPHTWAIPRLHGPAKAALVRLQSDEYGNGCHDQMHSTLFANTMGDLGLDSSYGQYLDLLPGVTLATVNLVSMFGLHRRWRGALVGHLALFETTSVVPMGRYCDGLLRLGYGASTTRFYDVHVLADVEHETIALEGLVQRLVDDEPALAGQVLFGARALSLVEQDFTGHLLGSWQTGHSSLLPVA